MQSRILRVMALLPAACLALQAADAGGGVRFASADLSSTKELSGLEKFDTSAAIWIWSDKNVYSPGEQLTLRWTIKPNGDLIPHTIVAFRQNNQTGEKFYLPGGGTQATDIFGRTADEGFDVVRLPEAEKAVLVGAGGMFPAVTIPNEPGMHTIVVQIRDFTGTRVVKSAYWKIGVVTGTEVLGGDITDNRTLVNSIAYELTGLAIVRDGGVLNIEPGTFIIGQPGSQPPSAIVIANNGRIEAPGTRSRPIIMTSSLPIGQRRTGDWGGLVLLGRAPVNWPGGVGNIEGLPPDPDTEYGGDDPNHNCGTLTYVRLEFAGAELRPNDEINAFTWGGCGKATTSHHLQSNYGLDDSFEWFGGNNDASYLVSAFTRDDGFDWQIGWTGRLQHFVALANLDGSNRGIEADNNENGFDFAPVSNPTLFNGTFIGVGDSFDQGVDEGTVSGIFLRRGTGGSINNSLIYNWVDTAVHINEDATEARFASDELNFNGLLLWQNGVASGAVNTAAGQLNDRAAKYIPGNAPNILVADPLLRNPFEFSDPDFRPLLGSPVFRANWTQPPDDGFLDQSANYIGAFGDEDWTEEWTTFVQEQDLAVQ